MTVLDATGKPKFYGRRKGRKLSSGRQELMDAKLPKHSIQLEENIEANSLDAKSLFKIDVKEVWMEIGFGGGEHLAWHAERNPDVGFIGCEPFEMGVASMVRHIEERGLKNVRILADDARPLMDALKSESLNRAFVLYADPWPKARHAFRRFIGPDNLPRLSRLLQDGAELRLASDDPTLIEWELEQMSRREDFDWLAEGPEDWRNRPEDWPPTRYEQKAIKQGRTPVYMRYKRLDRTD